MHFFSQYRGLRRENYVLFFGRIVTNMGSMVWPMLTMILNQKLGMSAGNIAILTAVFGILMMPATLFGGKLADRLNKKNIIIVGDIVSVVCYILCGCVPPLFFRFYSRAGVRELPSSSWQQNELELQYI